MGKRCTQRDAKRLYRSDCLYAADYEVKRFRFLLEFDETVYELWKFTSVSKLCQEARLERPFLLSPLLWRIVCSGHVGGFCAVLQLRQEDL
jgi:hypothetical protein